jgi:hypothetical protein
MTATKTKVKPGDRMDDGTIYAGISPETSKKMFTTPADAPLTYTFNEAAEYAKQLNAEKYLGPHDWRVPGKGEMNVLFTNRAAIGGFDETGNDFVGSHWSATELGIIGLAWNQRFSDGDQDWNFKCVHSSLRCMRG